jgi:hypothetical protein
MNQTYEEAADSIALIKENHTDFMQGWWHWRCDLEPWVGCTQQCSEREIHLNDPFMFCFSRIKSDAPEEASEWKEFSMKCQTYFSDGGMKSQMLAFSGRNRLGR